MPSVQYLTCITTFNAPNKPVGQGLLLATIYNLRKWGFEGLSNLFKTRKLVGAGIRT